MVLAIFCVVLGNPSQIIAKYTVKEGWFKIRKKKREKRKGADEESKMRGAGEKRKMNYRWSGKMI